MFAGWGSWVARFRWPVLTVALVAVVSSGLWGLGVFGQLTEGGYNDPNSESAHAAVIVQQALGTPAGDVVAIYTPTKGKIGDAALTRQIKARLAALPGSAVKTTSSYWQQRSAQYAAQDKSSAVAVITLVGPDDSARADQFRAIRNDFTVPGATVQLAGGVPLNEASSTRSTSDLGTAELVSLPITLALLLFIFGSLVAAALPVLVGGLAVLGSLGILHAVASHTEVNSFAVNVASLLGLGMAIDYGLFMVGRFREEQSEGRTPAEAVRRTVGTAGRTVLFSATLLMIALSGLLLFPQSFLNSLAYGGLSAVALAALLSLTLLPALLAVLGHRVDKLPVRLPRRDGAAPAGSGWARAAQLVLRRPVLVALPILAILLLLASPVRGVHFGDSDERILPAADPARVAVETFKADYPQLASDGIQIVLRGTTDIGTFAAAARAVPGIDQLGPTTDTPRGAIMTATLSSADPYSASARDAVQGIRGLPLPPGAQLLVGGTTARNLDSLHATAARLPLMIAMLAGATLLLMLLAFGSILLPIKAVVMSALSLSATFGVLVWIFEDGHLSGLLNITPAPFEVGIVVLMAAVVFGLSTDYEVFLLSRMVEARLRGATSAEAITTGLARTGRVISAAALLLIVVTGAFALSAVTTMRFVGLGMIIALLLDATIVRILLVPAVLGLLGDAAWWAPGPLRRLQQRAGLSEHEYAVPSGNHAAPDDTAVLTGVIAPRHWELASKSPVPQLLFRDEDRPDWARPSDTLPALTRPAGLLPFALPATTVVFPKVTDDATSLSNTVRIELEPAGEADEAAETVDAELVEGPDLEATGILTTTPGADEIADAEVVTDHEAATDLPTDPPPPTAADPSPAGDAVAVGDSAAIGDAVADDTTDPTSDPAFDSDPADEPVTADEPATAFEPATTDESAGPEEDRTLAPEHSGAGPAAATAHEPVARDEPAVADESGTVTPALGESAAESATAGTAGILESRPADVGDQATVVETSVFPEEPAVPANEFDDQPIPLDAEADAEAARSAPTPAEPIAEPTAATAADPAREPDAADLAVAPDTESKREPEAVAAADLAPEPSADLAPEASAMGAADFAEPDPEADPEDASDEQLHPRATPLLDAEASSDPEALPGDQPARPLEAEAGREPEADPVRDDPVRDDSVRDPEAEAPQTRSEPEAAAVESDTPLFAGTGSESYAALFPELFAPEPEPAVGRYPDWSAPVSEDAFFAPAAPDPFLYRREEPATDERYVTHTPADESTPEADLHQRPTADLSDRLHHVEPGPEWAADPSPEPAIDGSAASAPAPGPTWEPAPPSTSEPEFDSTGASPASEPAFEPERQPTFEPAPQRDFEPAPQRDFEPAPQPDFEPEPAPAFDRAPARASEQMPEPAFGAAPQPAFDRAPQRTSEVVPEPAFKPIPAADAVPEPRRPADLRELAAAWRQVIEHRPPVTERPADLAGYVGQTRRRPAPAPQPAAAPPPAATPQPTSAPQPTLTPEPAFALQQAPAPEPLPTPPRRPGRPTDLASYFPARRSLEPSRSDDASRQADSNRFADSSSVADPNPAVVANRPTGSNRPTDPSRLTDMGEMTGGWRRAADGREGRPADPDQYGQSWQPAEPWRRPDGPRRPESLGDQPPAPVRRPSSLADTVPTTRRSPDPVPGEGPTRDLSEYTGQE